MNYVDALPRLERLVSLVEKQARTPEEEREIPILYGELRDVIIGILGVQKIDHPGGSRGARAGFENYIEAGYLSGYSTYAVEGHSQLLTVYGAVRAKIAAPSAPLDEPSITTLVRVLNRFRQCSQYAEPPGNEKDVQDIVWVMLRSHFDRVDREDVLRRFGTKGYRTGFGLPEAIDTGTPTGRLLLGIMGSFAEFERERIRERIFAGLARARREGKKLGRKRQRISERDLTKVAGLSVREAADVLGVPASRIYNERRRVFGNRSCRGVRESAPDREFRAVP